GEVDIARAAQTTIVVEVPGMGDDVQSIKAGVLEIADLFVVNKADREGADKTVRQLRSMLHLGGPPADGWEPPVIPAVASSGQGVVEIIAEASRHAEHLRAGDGAVARARAAAEGELRAAVQELAVERLRGPAWDALVARIAARQGDPYSSAEELLAALERRS
ncbi:methylmalonyl Co-A mutase-associated GTPase MeaB, partial [Oscillochloris sp. ZM17-4]|nr:methylmalonyl Co-A mutase-associated GTPase MeaB [Oscillochloris sp. ZM17-4]